MHDDSRSCGCRRLSDRLLPVRERQSYGGRPRGRGLSTPRSTRRVEAVALGSYDSSLPEGSTATDEQRRRHSPSARVRTLSCRRLPSGAAGASAPIGHGAIGPSRCRMEHMILTEIDHVAIAVNDLEAAIDYYERAFGATVAHREIVEQDGVEEALLKVADSYIQLTRADPRRLADRQVPREARRGTAPRRLPRRRLRRRPRRRWSPPAPRRSTRRRGRAAAARPSPSSTPRAASGR